MATRAELRKAKRGRKPGKPTRAERQEEHRRVRHAEKRHLNFLVGADEEAIYDYALPRPRSLHKDAETLPEPTRPMQETPVRIRKLRHWRTKMWKRRDRWAEEQARRAAEWWAEHGDNPLGGEVDPWAEEAA